MNIFMEVRINSCGFWRYTLLDIVCQLVVWRSIKHFRRTGKLSGMSCTDKQMPRLIGCSQNTHSGSSGSRGPAVESTSGTGKRYKHRDTCSCRETGRERYRNLATGGREYHMQTTNSTRTVTQCHWLQAGGHRTGFYGIAARLPDIPHGVRAPPKLPIRFWSYLECTTESPDACC